MSQAAAISATVTPGTVPETAAMDQGTILVTIFANPGTALPEMPHPIHVAWVSNTQFDPSLRAGALHSFLGRLRFLRTLGYRVSIIDFVIDERSHQGFDQHLSDRGGEPVHSEDGVCRTVFQGVPYTHTLIPCQSKDELYDNPTKLADAMIPLIKAEGVDFAITTDLGFSALFAAWKLGLPGAHFFNTKQNIKRFATVPFYIRLLSKRGVLGNSYFMKDEIKKRLGLEAGVWFPFVDPERFRASGEEGPGKAGRQKRIGFYAFRGIKGSPLVDQMATLLPEYEFLVVGSTGDYQMKNQHGNITLLGFIDDMRELFYSKVDILLVPSTVKEAFSRVIVEARFNGIPVIANRVGGIPDALGDSGVQIDVGEGKDLDTEKVARDYATEIRRLLGNEDVLADYRRRALARGASYLREQEEMGREFVKRFVDPVV